LNELPLFGAPIIALPKLPNHLTYDEMVSAKFQPKQRKKDIWTTEEVALLFQTLKDISNGVLVPTVLYLYKYFYV
jgi:hypothetical protein